MPAGIPAPAVLGSQDCQRAEQGRSLGPGQHEGRPPRDLRRADARGRRSRDRRVRRQILTVVASRDPRYAGVWTGAPPDRQ
jgi:hypothetical protein